MDSVHAEMDASAQVAALDLGTFIRGLAHDIANPLNAISMNAELAKLMLERDQSARAGEVIDRVLADCARCGRLIQGLQRFGSGLHAHPRETVSMRTLVDEAIRIAREERLAGLPEVRSEGTDMQVRVDRPAFARAIAGLLHNAAEAGADAIQIQTIRDGESVLVHIRDDGAGIAPESLGKAAEPFYSTRRSEGGSGLGLTLASELLRVHGGGLGIAANAPRGTCVMLRLPADSAQCDDTQD